MRLRFLYTGILLFVSLAVYTALVADTLNDEKKGATVGEVRTLLALVAATFVAFVLAIWWP